MQKTAVVVLKKNLSRTFKSFAKNSDNLKSTRPARKKWKSSDSRNPKRSTFPPTKVWRRSNLHSSFWKIRRKKKNRFVKNLSANKFLPTRKKAEKIATKFDFKKVVENCAEIEEDLNSARGENRENRRRNRRGKKLGKFTFAVKFSTKFKNGGNPNRTSPRATIRRF
jgi:hypothetical protein